MGDELTESDLQRVKDLGHQTSKDGSEESSESTEASEVKTDDSNREESKETSESVAQASSSASGTEDNSTSAGGSSSVETSESKSPLVKWQSPEKADNLGVDNAEAAQEISPSHQAMRPATASSRRVGNVLKDIGMKFFHEVPKKMRTMFSAKPKKGEEAHLVSSDSASSSCGEQSSSKEVQFAEVPTEPREPLHAEVTGQEGGFLPSQVDMLKDSVNESNTDVTSLSASISLCDEAFQTGSHALIEAKLSKGSIQDAASLEVDFEEIPSPSKRAKLQMDDQESDSCEGMITSDSNNENDLEEQRENMSEDSEE